MNDHVPRTGCSLSELEDPEVEVESEPELSSVLSSLVLVKLELDMMMTEAEDSLKSLRCIEA